MRKSFLLVCIIVLVFCIWLVFHYGTKPTKNNLQATQTVLTNQPLASQPPQVQAAQNPIQTVPTIPQVKMPRLPLTTNEIKERALADWQKPIEFYGKVIDENSNPVEGASIQFQCAGFADKVDTSTTESDANGLFSLQGKTGQNLHISVGKDGYYISRRDKFDFQYSLAIDIYSPQEWNPVIFHLHKKGQGEPLIGGRFPPGMTIAQLHHDGTPVELNLLNGTLAPTGSGQLKLEFWRDISDLNKQPFDWKLQLSMLGGSGGIIPTDDEFAFQAPETGYQASIVIDMPATNQDWLGEVRSKYYIQLPNGNYGRIDFYLLPRNGVFTVGSTINPSGSRNLEPK